MAKDSGYEISPMNPGWIKRRVPDEYADDSLRDLIMFFVINTPCTDLSSSSIDLCDYGWGKDIWKNEKLKKALFQIAGIERGSTFVVAQKTNEMKSVCEKASLKKSFHKSRDIERIAIFKGRYNEFLSICYHIRNAFAHGRLASNEGLMRRFDRAVPLAVKMMECFDESLQTGSPLDPRFDRTFE